MSELNEQLPPELAKLLARFASALSNELIYGEGERASLKRCREYGEKTHSARAALVDGIVAAIATPAPQAAPAAGELDDDDLEKLVSSIQALAELATGTINALGTDNLLKPGKPKAATMADVKRILPYVVSKLRAVVDKLDGATLPPSAGAPEGTVIGYGTPVDKAAGAPVSAAEQADTMTVQEVWLAAGGNPNDNPSKEEVLFALKTMDQAIEECDAKHGKAQPAAMDEAAERARFEKWAQQGAHVTLSHVFSFTRHPNKPRYLEGTTELCWRAFQAGAASAAPAQAQAADPIGDMQAEARQRKLEDFIAAAAPAAVQELPALPIKTWEERMPDSVKQIGTAASEAPYKEAEIADLRAALAMRQPQFEAVGLIAAPNDEHPDLGWRFAPWKNWEAFGAGATLYAPVAAKQAGKAGE